jgi:hypothetical protein
LESLAGELGLALSCLESVLTPENATILFAELGLDAAPNLAGDIGFTQKLENAAQRAGALFPAIETLSNARESNNDLATVQAVGQLLLAIRGLVLALDDLATDFVRATAALPQTADLEAFALTFVDLLLGNAVVNYLELAHPFLRRILSCLAIVEMKPVTVPVDNVPTTVVRKKLHLDRVSRWLTESGTVFHDVYGWGENGFDGNTLLANVRDVFDALIPIAVIHKADEDDRSDLDLFGFLVRVAADASPPGLEGQLFANPAEQTDLTLGQLTDAFRVALQIDGTLADELTLSLHPPSAFGVRAAGNVAGQAAVKVLGTSTADEPFVLLGGSGASGLRATQLSAGLVADLRFDAGTQNAAADLRFEAKLGGGELLIDLSQGDGFLQSVLPSGGVSVAFDAGLSLSSARGFELTGGVGLQAVLPAHVSLGPIGSIDAVQLGLAARDEGLHADVSCAMTVHLGPVDVSIDGIGVRATISFPAGGRNLGVADLAVGFKAPTRLGLSVDSGPVVGGGFLAFDPERGEYVGEVQLQFEGIAVRAIGLLTTHLPGGKPGFSLLVIVSAEFPPLQLGLGFMLVGVGGLLGINRTVAVEALRAGVKTGALGAVLSPPDPKADIGQLVATLAGLFPPAAGRYVFAPTARIVWGSPTLITIELALVLELPAPVRLVVLGRLRAVLPDEREAIVRIQVDVLGVIDFDRSEAAVDATLVDSRLAQFALTGDMALRMSWGAQPSFLLAVGGFHPRFAAPPGFPALARVAVPLASGDNPKLRLEAYLALTSNTVQFGARVDLAAKAGSFSIAGFLSFDALVTLDPLAFIVDIAAKLAVKAGGHTLLSVSLALTLTGPRPWRARGSASFSILFLDISFGFDVTIGDDAQPVLPAPVDVAPLVLAAFADARSWSAQLPAGAAALVTLRALDPGTAVLAHPLATLQVRQRVTPLERTLDRFGTSVPSGARRFRITLATIGGVRTTLTPLQDRFAPAQFTALSDDAKLSAPSFEEMTSGAALGADGYATGAALTVSVVYEQLLVTAPGIPEPKSQRVAIPGDVFVTLTATPPERPPAFAMREAA